MYIKNAFLCSPAPHLLHLRFCTCVLRVADHCSHPLVVWGFSFKWLWSIYTYTDEHFLNHKIKLTSFTLLAVLFSSFLSYSLLLLFSASFVCIAHKTMEGDWWRWRNKKGKRKATWGRGRGNVTVLWTKSRMTKTNAFLHNDKVVIILDLCRWTTPHPTIVVFIFRNQLLDIIIDWYFLSS